MRGIRANVRGTWVNAITLDEAATEIENWVHSRRKGFVSLANVHVVEEARRDGSLASALGQASLVLPDGAPIAWRAGKCMGSRVERVSGADLFEELSRRSALAGHRVCFVGGTPEVLNRLRTTIVRRHPGLEVVGTESPSFGRVGRAEEANLIETINAMSPDIIWVGLGAPKQELWMARNRASLDAAALIGVGAVFDFVSGTKPRAPKWLQRGGLEWAHRLCHEPRRLARRYLETNSRFIFGLIAEALRSTAR